MSMICLKHCNILLKRPMHSINLLHEFTKRDEITRHEAMLSIQRILDSWYFGFGSPAVSGVLESVVKDTGGSTLDTSMHRLIKEQIPDLLRISLTVPLPDVRSIIKEILLDLKMDDLRCIADELSEEDFYYTTQVLFREYWFYWGRVCNHITMMGYHPEYLECFIKLEDHIFHADLPLPYPDRYYLAIMAAAEQRCSYLIFIFAQRFISCGGNPTWLQGIKYAPSKLRQLIGLNRNLASRPWLITSNDVYELIHGSEMNPSKETISLSELMHAVTILTQIHALSCFIFGCGIRPEIDHYDGLIDLMDNVECEPNCPLNSQSKMYDDSLTDANQRNGENDCISSMFGHSGEILKSDCGVALVKHDDDDYNDNNNCFSPNGDQPNSSVSDCSASNLLQIIQAEDSSLYEVREDMVAHQFTKAVSFNVKLDSEFAHWERKSSGDEETLYDHSVITRFLELPHLGYKNFDGKPFHVGEYSWHEEGSALADCLCSDFGSLLDEKFRNAYELTYNTLNDITNVDTSLYRCTVWDLVQSLFGICHDDFYYDRIDRLLNSLQRSFLKLCAVSPSVVNSLKDFTYEKVFPALSTSEIVHMILMVIEARHQSCLLYILRAISECQARSN